ncbi:hypothetical protein, partial [Mesorhizobium sp.]|uniref:hypothetical protein n=1 Tax=Mesorhizobium sp. TaxID=1871066 RepID=UPI00338F0F5E
MTLGDRTVRLAVDDPFDAAVRQRLAESLDRKRHRHILRGFRLRLRCRLQAFHDPVIACDIDGHIGLRLHAGERHLAFHHDFHIGVFHRAVADDKFRHLGHEISGQGIAEVGRQRWILVQIKGFDRLLRHAVEIDIGAAETQIDIGRQQRRAPGGREIVRDLQSRGPDRVVNCSVLGDAVGPEACVQLSRPEKPDRAFDGEILEPVGSVDPLPQRQRGEQERFELRLVGLQSGLVFIGDGKCQQIEKRPGPHAFAGRVHRQLWRFDREREFQPAIGIVKVERLGEIGERLRRGEIDAAIRSFDCVHGGRTGAGAHLGALHGVPGIHRHPGNRLCGTGESRQFGIVDAGKLAVCNRELHALRAIWPLELEGPALRHVRRDAPCPVAAWLDEQCVGAEVELEGILRR